ncbi:MAG TPA: pilus assembly protein PilB [Planctomycetes bacterium]|nr:pilus assembly protein PilB [Planctomycetota bacterium]
MVVVHERRLLGQILIDEGLISKEQLEEALAHQGKYGGAIGQVLVEKGYISQEDVLLALGQQAGMEVVDLEHMEIAPEVIEKVSPSMANIYHIVPILFESNVLTVAMADPMNVNALDDLRFLLNCEVRGAVAAEKSVVDAIERYYGSETENIEDILEGLTGDELMTVIEDDSGAIDISKAEELANAPPVVKLLNLVLLTAIRDQASDIHFEPFEDEFKIRYRIDGLLLEMAPPPRQLALAITSRIKVMSNLDIAETRLPQDGRIELSIGGNPVDLRVSTLPTMFGESVVMRVLDRSVVALDLERLGFQSDDLEFLRQLVNLPNGIVLVTGPTGSGKTTTLYSALNEVNDPALKIITTEDPVEYDLDGIVQVQINEEIGVTYAACLRSILRQDPDKILVGEIRDIETANIAIEASLTGHLVLSTLHTNDAPSTITRLLDMGLEPFLVSATLEAIVAQRLVRTICSRCRTQYVPTEESLFELGIRLEDVQGKIFYYGKRCDHCNKTGYRGRTAIFEIMKIHQKLRDLIIQRKSTEILRQEAMSAGMRTLREAGILKVFDGVSTIEEVVNETLVFT